MRDRGRRRCLWGRAGGEKGGEGHGWACVRMRVSRRAPGGLARTISHSSLSCTNLRTTGQQHSPENQAEVLPLTQHLIGLDLLSTSRGMHEL